MPARPVDAAASAAGVFTVASFNARWGLTVDDRPFDLAAVIADLDADLIAVQEVWEDAEQPGTLRAAAAAGGYHLTQVPQAGSFIDPRPEITADPDRMTGTWEVALLSRLPVRSTRIVELGRLIDRWDVATRRAVVAEIEVGDRVVTVGAVHLSFALPNAFAQLRTLRAHLGRNPHRLVVGDCNLWGPAVLAALGGGHRAVRGRTWPAHRPHSQLDHIVVGRGLEVVGGDVLAPAGSDHRPIRATLRGARHQA